MSLLLNNLHAQYQIEHELRLKYQIEHELYWNIKLNINYIETKREIISCHRRGEHHTPFYPSQIFQKASLRAIWCFKGIPFNRFEFQQEFLPCLLRSELSHPVKDEFDLPLFAHEGEKSAGECLPSSGVPRFLMSCRDRGRKGGRKFY